MLALAAPAIHDHSSSHTAPGTASKTPIVRSKPPSRRPPSSSSLSSTAVASSSSSASSSSLSSASSSSTVGPSTVSRTNTSASLTRAESTFATKLDVQASEASLQPKLAGAQAPQRPALSGASSMPALPPSENDGVDIHSYPTPDLLRLLASLLNQIATANDGLQSPPQPGSGSGTSSPQSSPAYETTPIWQTLFSASRTSLSTPTSHLTFHARNIPSISLEAYLLRILRYCPTTNEVFLSLLVYFDRMSKLAQDATGTRFVIDSYNVHRLVIAGVTVASKFFSDVFYTNSRYAKVGGLPQAELNQLELQFLLLNDFRLSIPTDEMQRYADQLIRFSQGQVGVDGAQPWTSPTAPEPPAAASRPMQSMGAFDAFGGAITNDTVPFADASASAPRTPRRSWSSSASAGASVDEHENSVCSETDTDAETDDEPTIRPAHSCASSDTQSLFSNDASEDSFVDTDDADGDGDLTDDDRPSTRRSRPPHHRWSSTASSSVDSSVDGDRLMASP